MASEVVNDVSRLVELAELKSIAPYRLNVERVVGGSASESVEISPRYTVEFDTRDDGHGFRVRFEVAVDLDAGSLDCAYLAEYDHGEAVLEDGNTRLVNDFVNGVALMHLIPYMRQGISDLTQRVFGTPLVMPIFQRGELEFQMDGAASAAAAD